jgi:transglutaminase-like putative cysteine protease
MRLEIEAVLDYTMAQPADVLLAIEVAEMFDQTIVEDMLTITGSGPLRPVPGDDAIGRRTWMNAEGPFHGHYRAVVDVDRATGPLAGLGCAPRRELPAGVVPYLWPSRYCEPDRFEAFVGREFCDLQGGDQIQAMADWIHEHLDYCAGTSDASTTAADTFVRRQGVCRDFAHLMATFARAAGIPARLVSAYANNLEPPDFHAVVEVWLDGGWRLVDATKLAEPDGIVRIAVGRDATDIAFMTVFGSTTLNRQTVSVKRIDQD